MDAKRCVSARDSGGDRAGFVVSLDLASLPQRLATDMETGKAVVLPVIVSPCPSGGGGTCTYHVGAQQYTLYCPGGNGGGVTVATRDGGACGSPSR